MSADCCIVWNIANWALNADIFVTKNMFSNYPLDLRSRIKPTPISSKYQKMTENVVSIETVVAFVAGDVALG